jgi:hypothetical protein
LKAFEASSWLNCRIASPAGLPLVAMMASRAALAGPASVGEGYDGIGMASVEGSASAAGSCVGSEWHHLAASGIARAYEGPLAPPWGLRAEAYGLPQRIHLGLGVHTFQFLNGARSS